MKAHWRDWPVVRMIPVWVMHFNAAERHFLSAGFNLLPYRAARARARTRRYLSELMCAALAGCVVAYVASHRAGREMAYMKQQQKTLEQQLAALQPALAQRTQQKTCIQAFTVLHAQRGILTKLLAVLARAATADIRLMALNYEAGTSTLTGMASSSNALSHWLNRLRDASHFSSVELRYMRRRTDSASLPHSRDAVHPERTVSAVARPFLEGSELSFQVQLKSIQPAQTPASDATTVACEMQQAGQT